MDEIFFFAGATLFLLAVIVFWVGWVANEKAAKQQNTLSEWESDLNEWALAQQKNITQIQQELVGKETAFTEANVELKKVQQALTKTEHALEEAAQQAEGRALALQNYNAEFARLEQELLRVRRERDQVKADFAKFVDFLVDAGVLRRPSDALTVSSANLQEFYIQPSTNSALPDVTGFTSDQLRAALLHATRRAFSDHVNAHAPFTRSYMVTMGPLSHNQYEALLKALHSQGYLRASGHQAGVYATSYELTDDGWTLLQSIKEGTL